MASAQEQPTPTQDPIAPLQQQVVPIEQPPPAATNEPALIEQPPAAAATEQPVVVEQPATTAAETPVPAKRNTYLPAQDNYEVFVLGDSLAGGLFAGMERLTIGDKEIHVGGRFKEDSGIARPEFYDWNDAIPKILESNKVDIAVILIGTNDAQPMIDGVEKLEFGTPQWTALYSREIDRLINTLKQDGAAVYWVSLPPMQAPSYNASIAEIAEIQKRQAQAASIKYIDVRAALTDPDGKMMVRGPDDTGDLRKIRDNDGIHFMKVGNNKLAKLILDVLRTDIANARSNTPAAEEVAAPIVEDATGKSETGQVPPEALASEDSISVETGKSNALESGKTDLAFKGAITLPAPENPTARFFRTGEAPPPVAGRFDDFSYTE
ncbi:MAG: DUF459 domain-containing protein [Hyphomicrobiales bacterium]